jgi:ubiquinol-cytochrome c reductase iron-sulfur subunit
LAQTTTHPITAGPEAKHIEPHEAGMDVTRRDFLLIATGAFAAIGAAATLWPFIDQMNPDASALALASTEVDVSAIEPGQSITVVWRGKPVAIRYRTEAETKEAQEVSLDDLKDPLARNANLDDNAPATDANRAVPGKEQWLVMVQVCTHLGCIPLGQQGEFGGWFCPCHGSVYDTAGRIRRGPAPENMAIPPFAFTNDTTLNVG